MANCYVDDFAYDDRRRFSGNPIRDLRATAEQILSQYSRFDAQVLAVRGEHLQLARCRWSNDSGFETTHLIVNETGDDGRFIFEARFDADDFEGAYRELDRRYYASDGAEFAASGTTLTEVVIALNRGEFDRVFEELAVPGAPVENRSRLPFPDRSADVLRASFADLDAMVASTRTWFSAMCWVSNAWAIVRFEREAVGADGEHYAWAHLVVLEVHDGRVASMCEFEIDDEKAAFAYAEERVRQGEQG